MPSKRAIRDPIHGFIEYDETEERVINSQPFQRLRSIRQLALASIVYPGAHHTRFEHCLGAMHLAGRVAERLELSPDRRKIVRLAGLLHDIGHGPFSHVSEHILEELAGDLPHEYEADNAHELMSILIVQRHPDLLRALSDAERDGIVGLLKKVKGRSVDKDIVSGPLDVDKLDYLLRDSYFAGVSYGLFDIDKVIESLTPIRMGVGLESLGITEEGVHALEQLRLARYHMNVQVYSHRVRRITDAMLVRGIELGLRDKVEGLAEAFAVEDSEEFIKQYCTFTDEALVQLMLNQADGSSKDLFLRTRERRLLKEVFRVSVDTEMFPSAVTFHSLMSLNNDNRERIGAIAGGAARLFSDDDHELSPDMVIVDRQSVSNPTFKSPAPGIHNSDIMVQVGPNPKLFTEMSPIFKTDDPSKDDIYVYLPLDWIEDKDERVAYAAARWEAMKAIVEEAVK